MKDNKDNLLPTAFNIAFEKMLKNLLDSFHDVQRIVNLMKCDLDNKNLNTEEKNLIYKRVIGADAILKKIKNLAKIVNNFSYDNKIYIERNYKFAYWSYLDSIDLLYKGWFRNMRFGISLLKDENERIKIMDLVNNLEKELKYCLNNKVEM